MLVEQKTESHVSRQETIVLGKFLQNTELTIRTGDKGSGIVLLKKSIRIVAKNISDNLASEE